MIALFAYLKDCHMEEDKHLFFAVPESRTRSNGLELQEGGFG